MHILKIQYLSNLFLHTHTKRSKTILKKSAPILALCGNIGRPTDHQTKDFFQEVDEKYSRVFWIPGLLEYSTICLREPTTWKEQSDLCYKALKDWNLKRTTFCQKYSLELNNNLTLLATPLWHSSFMTEQYVVYYYNDREKVRMGEIEYSKLQKDETVWIQNQCYKTNTKKLLLSYSPSNESINVLCHLYGTELIEEPVSYTGGSNPWCGLNMYSSKNYLPNAYLELDTTKTKYL